MIRTKLLFFALFVYVSAGAQQLPPSELTIERLYSYPLIHGRSPASPAMSPSGKHIVYGWNKTGERKLDVWLMDFPSGKAKPIVAAARIEPFPRQDDERTEEEKKEELLYDAGISGFQWAPDGKEFLFQYKGRVWTCSLDGKQLEPLIDAGNGQKAATYSPDGKAIGYLQGQNLFRFDRKTGRIKQLTFLSKAKTEIDGYTLANSYAWSPDGKRIALAWSDTSKFGSHIMMDFSKDRAKVVDIQREWVGDSPLNVKVGVIPAEGGLIKFLDGLPTYLWLTGLEWSPDSNSLGIGWMDETFQEWNLSTANLATMRREDCYTEKAPKNYIPDFRPFVWTRDSKGFVFGTDIIDGAFGFRSIMKVGVDGKGLEKLYAEKHDVTSLKRPKDSDRLFLSVLADSALTGEIVVLEPNGKQTRHKMIENGMSTPVQFDESGDPLVSDDGRLVATMASNRQTNPELYAVEPRAARLTHSQTPLFQKVRWSSYEEVTFTAPDGKPVRALLILPPNLDKSKSHPAVISNLYANSAKRSWSGYLENYLASELGVVVLQVDFRGSWGYGGEFNSGYAKSLGVVDSDELVAAKGYLASLGYVRPDRVGLYGWSYGGFLTCMAMFTKPGVFDTGVAVASVTDWKNYNEWYVRRRLGLVKDDAEVYKKTSPIHHAAGLQGNLLLVHGMLDDNVLYHDTARLYQKLIDSGKYFDSVSYPKDNHSIGRNESRPHVFGTIARYLYFKLSRA